MTMNVNNIGKKIFLGTLAAGLGCAGYVVGSITRTQPTKATVEVEQPNKNDNHSTTNQQTTPDDYTISKNKQTKNKSENQTDKKDHADSQSNEKSNQSKNKQELFLTGKKSKREYSPELIKRANQIYKHRSNLSFRECLDLARKENN